MKPRTIQRLALALFLTAIGIFVFAGLPGLAGAHSENGGGATWADAHGDRIGGYWYATLEDIKDDGECVSIWTINRDGSNAVMMVQACYGDGVVSGSAWGGPVEDEFGVRMWLGDFRRYSTLVEPSP